MKTKLTLLAVLATALNVPAFPADSAASKTQDDARVEIAFSNPEKFTDVRETMMMESDKQRENVLAQIKDHLLPKAARQVPEGAKLAITITDIDLAGDFEPWRGTQFHDIRVVKDAYPPRINLAFKLTDAAGAVLKEGERQLRDVAFQMKATPINSSDPLRYEKALLDDWLRSEFRKEKK
jgi:hypothetical protein